MNLNDVMQELEQLGSEQTRKTWRRHGLSEPMFGVKYGDLAKVEKRIKTNHALALELWQTGNHDARVLATKVADPKQLSTADVERWVLEGGNYVLADAVVATVAKAGIAPEQIAAWTESESEWLARAGWHLLGQLAVHDTALPDTFFYPFLETITADIHNRKNRVREGMNNALIAIGTRNANQEARAIEVARAIGVVMIDHGDTACKTPDAESYILKTNARRQRASA